MGATSSGGSFRGTGLSNKNRPLDETLFGYDQLSGDSTGASQTVDFTNSLVNPWKAHVGGIWDQGIHGMDPGNTLAELAWNRGGHGLGDTIAQGIINTLGIPGYASDIGGREGSQLQGQDRDTLHDWWQYTFLPALRGGPLSTDTEGTGGGGGSSGAAKWAFGTTGSEENVFDPVFQGFSDLPPSLPSFADLNLNFDDTQLSGIQDRLGQIEAWSPELPAIENLGTSVTDIYQRLYGGGGYGTGISGFDAQAGGLGELYPDGDLAIAADKVKGLLGDITDFTPPAGIGQAQDQADALLQTLNQDIKGTFPGDGGIRELINDEIKRARLLGNTLGEIEVPNLGQLPSQITTMAEQLPGIDERLSNITGMGSADRELMSVISQMMGGRMPTAAEMQAIVTALTPELQPYQVTASDLTMPDTKVMEGLIKGAIPELGVDQLGLPEKDAVSKAVLGLLPTYQNILDKLIMPDASMLLGKMAMPDADQILGKLPFGDITSDNLLGLLPGVDPVAFKDEVLDLMPDIAATDLSLPGAMAVLRAINMPDADQILGKMVMPDAAQILGELPFQDITGANILDRMPGVSPVEFENKILSLMPKIEAGDLSLPEAGEILSALPFDEVTKSDLLNQFLTSPTEFQTALLQFLPQITASDLKLPSLEKSDLGLPEVTAADMRRLGVLPGLTKSDLGLPEVTAADMKQLGVLPGLSAADLDLPGVTTADLGLPEAVNTFADVISAFQRAADAEIGDLGTRISEITPPDLSGTTLADMGLDTTTFFNPLERALADAIGEGSPLDLGIDRAEGRIEDLKPTIDPVTQEAILGAISDPLSKIPPSDLIGALPFGDITGDQMLGAMGADFFDPIEAGMVDYVNEMFGGDSQWDETVRSVSNFDPFGTLVDPLQKEFAKERFSKYLEGEIGGLLPESLIPQVEGLLPDSLRNNVLELLNEAMPTDITPQIEGLLPKSLESNVAKLLTEAMPTDLTPQIEALLPDKLTDEQISSFLPETLTDEQIGGFLPSRQNVLNLISGRLPDDLIPGDVGIDFSGQDLIPSDVGIDFSGQNLLPGDVGIDFSGEDQLSNLQNLGLDFSGIRDLTEMGMPEEIWNQFSGVGDLANFVGGMDQGFWGNLQGFLEGRMSAEDFNTAIARLDTDLTKEIRAGKLATAGGEDGVGDGDGAGDASTGEDEMPFGTDTWLKGLQDQIAKSYGRDPSEFGTAPGETYSDWLRADPITASLLADFGKQTDEGRSQLKEDLNRLGLLTTSTDTTDALVDYDTAAMRGEGQVLSDAAKRMQDLRTGAMDRAAALTDTMSRRDIGIADLLGYLGEDRTLGGREADMDVLAAAMSALDPDLQLGTDDLSDANRQLFELITTQLDLPPETISALAGIIYPGSDQESIDRRADWERRAQRDSRNRPAPTPTPKDE